MSERRIVFWGFGGLRWARLDRGPFGQHWETGGVGGWIGLGGGLQFGQDGNTGVCIHPALTASELTVPAREPATLEPLPPGQPDPPQVPEFAEVVRGLARWMTKELGGAGVLVVPPNVARDTLWEWADVGWRLEPLKLEHRIVAFDGPLVRLGHRVTAASGAAAAALACADGVVRRMVELAGGDAALRWHDGEGDRQLWFARQQVALRLLRGERDLGGQAPVFAAAPGLERLHRLRVRVTPPTAVEGWWAKAEDEDLVPRDESFSWVEGPDVDEALGFHLDMAGRQRSMVRIPSLLQRIGDGTTLDALYPSQPLLPEPPPPLTVLEPEPEDLPELELDDPDTGPVEPPPLPPFDPGWIELPGHRAGTVTVTLDGRPVDAELEELAPGILRIQRPEVPHGAVLRVDFEPTR